MRDAEKNRDPERAQKRARADARCALRKLDLLDRLEKWGRDGAKDGGYCEYAGIHDEGYDILFELAQALGVEIKFGSRS